MRTVRTAKTLRPVRTVRTLTSAETPKTVRSLTTVTTAKTVPLKTVKPNMVESGGAWLVELVWGCLVGYSWREASHQEQKIGDDP